MDSMFALTLAILFLNNHIGKDASLTEPNEERLTENERLCALPPQQHLHTFLVRENERTPAQTWGLTL